MEHTYGITFNFSFKFKDKIENISDSVSQKKSARIFFGNTPLLTPNKMFLLFGGTDFI